MSKILNAFKWGITLGKEPQNFLGAKWIQAFLNRVSRSRKRLWALRILSLSPHYFLDPDNPDYRGMSNDEYLQATFESLTKSREGIYQKILKPYLEASYEVLDYGCGPGFLAMATAPHVKKIYAVDISAGALACARIINSAINIEYILADKSGIDSIPDGQVDAIYSFAVVQHLTNEIFETVLETCRNKLRPDGQLLLHIQLTDDIWKPEEAFTNDGSVKGRLKYKIGLHCFGRSEAEHIEIVSRHNFMDVRIEKLGDMFPEFANDLHSQRLLTARMEI